MQLEEFLKNANYFSLGHLPTEGFHADTRNLSEAVNGSPLHLLQAVQTIQKIDLAAIQVIQTEKTVVLELSQAIQKTLASGHRIFLSGCGATGRLALSLETTWRKIHHGTALENRVQALMAGGDFALVKSVENFEDFPEYGSRHLTNLGFTEGDLLIAITEGGETPYVIGTVQGALQLSTVNPWFVYCNPRELLCQTVERSREVIEHPRVHSLCLSTGPMALSGSTRLQAATVQMLAVGVALLHDFSLVDEFLKNYAELDLAEFLAPVIEWESQVYLQKGTVVYQTDSYPIAVLTDTTERSPTFSLTPFELPTETAGPFSLCYLSIPGAHTALDSWQAILNRTPIGLDWPELHGLLNLDSILEFNFGREAIAARATRILPQTQNLLRLESHPTLATLEFKTEAFTTQLKSDLLLQPLLDQILVKLLLNTLSLMVMGKLNRYEGNVMTWVRPSNGKLIDRTVRYLEFLIEKRKLPFKTRAELVELVFKYRLLLNPNEAIILRILEEI
jgi:N-acetylmuramic acid 6-phosphate etherase